MKGKIVIVTGANSGIGFETALALAGKGAAVTLAVRNEGRGRDAAAKIRAYSPRGSVSVAGLDLTSLDSVRAFAERFAQANAKLDILVNNAGVMSLPARTLTADGHELQFGVNYLSHFALTARLVALLRAAEKARVVQVSSLAHRRGALRLDDLDAEKKYQPWAAYAQSKLAMLMFALEMNRRAETFGWPFVSLAAHPGFAQTNIVANGPAMHNRRALLVGVADAVTPLLGQDAKHGAAPILYAATSADIEPGGYYGPGGFGELRGAPKKAAIAAQARDKTAAEKLWEASEAMTGLRFAETGVR